MIKTDENGHDMLVIEWRIEDIIATMEDTYHKVLGKDFTIPDAEEILSIADKMSPDVDWVVIAESCENWLAEHEA